MDEDYGKMPEIPRAYSGKDITKAQQTPMVSELDRLGEGLERVENQLHILGARLSPVLRVVDSPSQAMGERPHPVMSDHVQAVWVAANRVEDILRHLAQFTDELEI